MSALKSLPSSTAPEIFGEWRKNSRREAAGVSQGDRLHEIREPRFGTVPEPHVGITGVDDVPLEPFIEGASAREPGKALQIVAHLVLRFLEKERDRRRRCNILEVGKEQRHHSWLPVS